MANNPQFNTPNPYDPYQQSQPNPYQQPQPDPYQQAQPNPYQQATPYQQPAPYQQAAPYQQPARRPRSRVGFVMMMRGIAGIAIGIVLTVVARAIAETTNSSFSIVFTGLIIGGLIYTVIGFFRWIAGR